MDIADFIRARLNEDQANAEHIDAGGFELQDIEKRRRLFESALTLEKSEPPIRGLQDDDTFLVLQNLAAKYAGHPDFEPAWQVPE